VCLCSMWVCCACLYVCVCLWGGGECVCVEGGGGERGGAWRGVRRSVHCLYRVAERGRGNKMPGMGLVSWP
jgi:hypothetical protein